MCVAAKTEQQPAAKKARHDRTSREAYVQHGNLLIAIAVMIAGVAKLPAEFAAGKCDGRTFASIDEFVRPSRRS
jgi:hypothetical protein